MKLQSRSSWRPRSRPRFMSWICGSDWPLRNVEPALIIEPLAWLVLSSDALSDDSLVRDMNLSGGSIMRAGPKSRGAFMAKRWCGSSGKWCPICGAWPEPGRRGPHRCDPKVLASIDGAHRRDPDEEELRDYRSYNQRIEDGFFCIYGNEDEYGDDLFYE